MNEIFVFNFFCLLRKPFDKNGKRSSDDDWRRSCEYLAFTGGNFLFSKLGKNQDAEKERERHDKAVEKLEAAQAAWSKKNCKDWILSMSKYKKNITQSRLLMM